jgi:cephalosporin-C deacetylase-like acetyl esterase
MSKNIFLSLYIPLLLMAAGCSQEIMHEEWKFHTGDNPEYADSEFNDNDWSLISPMEVWENQGFDNYDGFAWYRLKVHVPASMKRVAKKYDGLIFRAGKIDDADVSFFNGHILGSTGKLPPEYASAWDAERSYLIAPEYVNWGGENTIAVRVYDGGGDGGLYGGPAELTLRGDPDLLSMECTLPEDDMIIKGSPAVSLPLSITSDLEKKYRGTLSLTVTGDMGENVITESRDITVKSKSTEVFSITLDNLIPGFYTVNVTVESRMGKLENAFNFGYEPEKIVSPADPQPDFKEFWQETKAELATVDPGYRLIKIDSLCTDTHNLYLVEMRSFGNALIRGWYRVPVKPGTYPAIMQVPGYSGAMIPSYINYGDDIIGFGLNIRGHGNSIDDVNPGFPGYILTNLDDRDKYIYRGAYMDCIRGIDFLCSRPEVDRERIAVTGASQGGALTFATAALDNERIAVCAPEVPFLSDFRDYFKIAPWPANEFVDYVEKEKRQTWEEVYTTLSYFDIKNLAPMIRAPLIMGVGLMDMVCPPHINFAAYNNVDGKKKYIAYPEAGHGLPADFYKAKMDWIKTEFGID